MLSLHYIPFFSPWSENRVAKYHFWVRGSHCWQGEYWFPEWVGRVILESSLAQALKSDGRNQGQFAFQNCTWFTGIWNQGQFSKYSSLLPKHTKVRTQRDRFSLIFIINKEYFFWYNSRRNVYRKYKNFCTFFIISLWCIATGAFWQKILAPGCWFFIVHGRNIWIALWEQICAFAPVNSRPAPGWTGCFEILHKNDYFEENVGLHLKVVLVKRRLINTLWMYVLSPSSLSSPSHLKLIPQKDVVPSGIEPRTFAHQSLAHPYQATPVTLPNLGPSYTNSLPALAN